MPKYKGTYTTIARVKLIVVIRTFVLPIVVAVIIFAIIVSENFLFNVIMAVALATGCLIKFFVGKKRYLTNIHLSDDQLSVQNINGLLQVQTGKLRLINITAIEIIERNILFGSPAGVNIKYKNKWQEYSFVNRKSRRELQPLIEEATRIIVVMHHHEA